jgi:hypothetical protein
MYGLLAGGARLALPPLVDLPVVRTLRAAMVDRLARSYGVVLTHGARRILVDIEETATIRGNVTQGVRWAFERFVPGAVGAVDVVDGVRRPADPVFSEIEAERVRAALRSGLALLETERAQDLVEAVGLPMRTANEVPNTSMLERWGEALAATLAEAPAAWLEVAEKRFVETLARYR